MANETRQIRIESILGGHAPTTHFSRGDQYLSSIGIDPSFPIDDSGFGSIQGVKPSGLIRPVGIAHASETMIANPMWIEGNPKEEGTVYVYGATGSVYTLNDNYTTLTALGDLTDGGTAQGNGMAYYDNYMYFSRSTTVARYGPLNGTPSFTDDYWVSTLGLTALEDTNYPVDFDFTLEYPNHVLHRHSDGRLYIADVVGNQGTIHYIQTDKTSVEGDTNAGSFYSKLQLGYGLHPTAMETYGTDLVIALNELEKASGSRTVKSRRAKLAFWDTNSDKANKIIWVEFPDQMITALKNVNGVLYVVSGNQYTEGFRVSRFIGGYTFEEVEFIETGQPCFPGAVDGVGDRLYFGSWTNVPETQGCVYSRGLSNTKLSEGIFNIIPITGIDSDGASTNVNSMVSSLKVVDSSYGFMGKSNPVMGVSQSIKNHSIAFVETGSYDNAPCVWWSKLFNPGQPFKITRIRIPLAQAVAANMEVIPKIYTDEGKGTTFTFATIDNTNYDGKRNIVYRASTDGVITGDHNFWLELRFTGSALCTVSLPIIIEYELLPDSDN